MWLCHGGRKMSDTKINKESSISSSKLYFNAYQQLLRQKVKIDQELGKIQSKILKSISNVKSGSKEGIRKTYVPRVNNKISLVDAIRESMTPNVEMTMTDILESLKSKGIYSTNSKYIYTMINNKLNRDKQVKKVGRGIFIYHPKSKKVRKTKEQTAA